MYTRVAIIKEINKLSIEKQKEVLVFIRSLNTESEPVKDNSEKVLSFAGSFSDMSKKDYGDFKRYTKQVRASLFGRDH